MKAKRTPKRRRPSVEEDLEVPPLKMRRIAGMDIGPNRRSYRYGESPDNSKSLEQMVSPTQQRRLWQGRDGRTHRDVDAHLAPEQQDLWLESNKRWDHGLNELWKGKRVLGHGGFGVVGLWEYTKSNNDVARVVVKQSVGKDHALRRESDLLSLMSQTGTRHVVGLLKKYHEERGHGTSAKWDPDSAYISRIYLEYCEKGDMKAVMRRVRYAGSPMCSRRFVSAGLTYLGILKEKEISCQRTSSGRYGSAWPGAYACCKMATRT